MRVTVAASEPLFQHINPLNLPNVFEYARRVGLRMPVSGLRRQQNPPQRRNGLTNSQSRRTESRWKTTARLSNTLLDVKHRDVTQAMDERV